MKISNSSAKYYTAKEATMIIREEILERQEDTEEGI